MYHFDLHGEPVADAIWTDIAPIHMGEVALEDGKRTIKLTEFPTVPTPTGNVPFDGTLLEVISTPGSIDNPRHIRQIVGGAFNKLVEIMPQVLVFVVKTSDPLHEEKYYLYQRASMFIISRSNVPFNQHSYQFRDDAASYWFMSQNPIAESDFPALLSFFGTAL